MAPSSPTHGASGRCRRQRPGRRRSSSCQTSNCARPARPAGLLLDEHDVGAGRRAGRADVTVSPVGPADHSRASGRRGRPSPHGAVHLVRGARRGLGAAQVALQHPRAVVPRDLVVVEPAPARSTATSPAASRRRRPSVPQLPGEDDGDDVDGPVLVPAVALPGASRSSATRSSGPSEPSVGRQHDPLPRAPLAPAAAEPPGPRQTPRTAARAASAPADAERPAAEHVGQEVHAQPHAGQPDDEDERHARPRGPGRAARPAAARPAPARR